MDVLTLKSLVQLCDQIYMGKIFKAVFLLAFFGFLRLSNISPHSYSAFDPSRHLAAGDLIFSKKYIKVIIKWSKTQQNRDSCKVLTLPRLKGSPICPFAACKAALKLYNPQDHEPLFQYPVQGHWRVLTDSRIRKCLSSLIKKLGFPPSHFTFHTFRRSGATLAYNSHIPIQQIKTHGQWTSDCVWTYIQSNHTHGESIANAMASVIM